MSYVLDGPVLEVTLARLEPLEHRPAADLALAAEEDRGSYRLTRVPRAHEVGAYIDAQLARAPPPEARALRAGGPFLVTSPPHSFLRTGRHAPPEP
jgi:hypothetical protein